MTIRTEEPADGVTLYLGDCRDILPKLGSMDAVVTDPPYGIGMAERGTLGSERNAPVRDYGKDSWDNETVPEDLMALVRASAQWKIIFGGNYYNCPPTTCWLVWDKLNTGGYADCELAWTNLPKAVRRIQFRWNGMIRQNGEARGDHPTQKPIEVMRWCIGQLPSDARTILDPFMGSGTTGVAAVKMGREFIGIERKVVYFDAACRRIEEAARSPDMFIQQAAPPPPAKQIPLL